MATRRDRCAGILWGLAAGDKNHGPMRMAALLSTSIAQTHATQKTQYATQGNAMKNTQNSTQEAQNAVTQSHNKAQETHACAQDFVFAFDGSHVASMYLQWYCKDEPFGCLDMGNTFNFVFGCMKRGMSNVEAANKFFQSNPTNAGINSAHRSVPIAMAYCIPDDHILKIKKRVHAAQTTNVILRELIKGHTWDQAVDKAKNIAGLKEEILKALNNVNGSKLSKGGYAPDVLEAAIYFVTKYEEPEIALYEALRFAGPDNFCPVLVGALVGARAGHIALRERCAHELDHISRLVKNYLESATKELVDMWPLE